MRQVSEGKVPAPAQPSPAPVVPTLPKRAPPACIYRVDFPCSLLGIAPPPAAIHATTLHEGDHWSLHVQTAAGRAPHVARWVASHAMADIHIEEGIAPTDLWVRLVEPMPALSNIIGDATIRGIEMTPEGTVSAFIAGDAAGMQRFSTMVGCQTEDLSVREAFQEPAQSVLTPRQRQALSIAVAMGYYELPRRATLRDVASRMGMSCGAASELLRRGERIIISGFVDDQSGCLGDA